MPPVARREGEGDPWYTSWFGEEYLALYPNRDDAEADRQARFVLGLLAPYAGRGRFVLDLACGTGRHAVVLASGLPRVAGLDLSSALLGVARRRPSVPAPGWIRADMRSLPFRPGTLGAVASFFTSFGYFDDPADDRRGLAEIARSLAPGGAFLADVFNAARVLSTLVSYEEKTVAHERVSIRRRFDPAGRFLEKEITLGTGERARVFRERVRVYTRAALETLHVSLGLSVRGLFGDFDGSPFDVRRSPRLILLAEKEAS